MNDGAEMTVETPVLPTDLRRARALAALSVALGAFSCIAAWRVAVLRTFPNTFPWLTLALALAGTVTAIMALRGDLKPLSSPSWSSTTRCRSARS